MPQHGAGKEVGHGKTPEMVGRDAYPCPFIDLDAVVTGARGRQHTHDGTPFSLPVFA